VALTLLLRRVGRGRWSPIHVDFDPRRQPEWPTAVEARVGTRIVLFGVTYRVSRILT
jgi:hypothetical protein